MRRMLAGAAVVGCLTGASLAPATVAAAPATTVVDCGAGADLQAAIDAATPGDTLVIRGTCVGSFVIDKDLVLEAGKPKAMLDARGSGTVMTIPRAADPTASAIVSISDLRITGGNPAGIENYGYLTLQNSTVSGNTGVGISHDGEYTGCTATLLNSVVRGNTGDGITNNWATVTLQNSRVSGNTGVGLQSWSHGNFVLDRSTVSGNGNGIDTGEQSGYTLDRSTVSGNTGRGIFNWNGYVVLDNATVSDNRGGGIWDGELGYLTVRHSKVTGNTADFGGGIYIGPRESNRGVTIEDSTIKGNTARTSGGGVYIEGISGGDVFARVVFSKNTAGISGGGIYKAPGGSLTLTDVVFRHNTPDNCFGC